MIACLLPARNAEAEIEGWLESATGFADAIVALDDGSTDRTAELLRAAPGVAKLLSNDERPGYGEWDDGANRRRLLAAAGDLEPDWIVFLDADERIDAEDARALREFLRSDAIAPCAYGLTMFDEVAPGSGRGSTQDGLPGVRVARGDRAARPAIPLQPGAGLDSR